MTAAMFRTRASTVDGERGWTVEADMQLGEWISAIADKAGTEPVNVCADDLAASLKLLPESSALHGVAPEHVVSRAAVLRVANRYIARALPYMQVESFHRLWQLDRFGYCNVVDAVSTVDRTSAAAAAVGKTEHSDPEFSEDGGSSPEEWEPVTTASRVQRLRRLIFEHTKRAFWHDVLQATTTPTVLPQDEYEDPREIRTIKINRVKAAGPRLAALTNPNDRLRNSVFGQLHREMRSCRRPRSGVRTWARVTAVSDKRSKSNFLAKA